MIRRYQINFTCMLDNCKSMARQLYHTAWDIPILVTHCAEKPLKIMGEGRQAGQQFFQLRVDRSRLNQNMFIWEGFVND